VFLADDLLPNSWSVNLAVLFWHLEELLAVL
jgi:hypothetical protein